MFKFVFVYSFAIWIGLTCGYGRFRYEIPNGFNVKHPCGGQLWEAVGHMTSQHTPNKNAFGQDVRTMVRAGPFDWSKVCNLDSDGDGMTNGQELGDPQCTWTRGVPDPGPVQGHPGFCEQNRPQCTKGFTHNQCPNPHANRGGQGVSQPKPPPPGSGDHPQTLFSKNMAMNTPSQIGGRRQPNNFNQFGQVRQPTTSWQGQSPIIPLQPTSRFTGTSIFGPSAQAQGPPQQMQFDHRRSGSGGFPSFTRAPQFPWQNFQGGGFPGQGRTFQSQGGFQQPGMPSFDPRSRFQPRMSPGGPGFSGMPGSPGGMMPSFGGPGSPGGQMWMRGPFSRF